MHRDSAALKLSSRYFAKEASTDHVQTAIAIQLTTEIGIQLKNKWETEVIFKRQVQGSVKEKCQVYTWFFFPFFFSFSLYFI